MKKIATACVLSVLCASSYGTELFQGSNGGANGGFRNSSSGDLSSGKSLSQPIVIPDSDDSSVPPSSRSDSESEGEDLPQEQFWDERTQFAPNSGLAFLISNPGMSDEEVAFDVDAVVADARSRGETIVGEDIPRKIARTENTALKNRQKRKLPEGQTAITKYFHDMASSSEEQDSQSVLSAQGSRIASAGSSVRMGAKRCRKKKELPVRGPLDAFLVRPSDTSATEDSTSLDVQASQDVFGTQECRTASVESAKKSCRKPKPRLREVTLAYNPDGSKITGGSPKKPTNKRPIRAFWGTRTKRFILSELSQISISAKDAEFLCKDKALQHVDLQNTLKAFDRIGSISDHVITAFISENTLHNFDPWDKTQMSCPKNLQRTLGTRYEQGVTALIIPDGIDPDLLDDQLRFLEMEDPEYSKVSVIICEKFHDWSRLTSLRSLFTKFRKVPYIIYNRDEQTLGGRYYSNKREIKWRLGYDIPLSIFGSASKVAE